MWERGLFVWVWNLWRLTALECPHLTQSLKGVTCREVNDAAACRTPSLAGSLQLPLQ